MALQAVSAGQRRIAPPYILAVYDYDFDLSAMPVRGWS
jgi:hypothetical protein